MTTQTGPTALADAAATADGWTIRTCLPNTAPAILDRAPEIPEEA